MSTPREFPNLPIIDFSIENLNHGSILWLESCEKVRHALEEYGFFVALYDNVITSKFDNQVFDVVQELFDLPLESKTRNTSDLVFYGYVGQLPHAPLHESMGIPDVTSLDAVQGFTNLMWPLGNKTFCDTIRLYAKLVSELEKIVDKIVFESYGVPEECYKSHIGFTTYLLRTIKYSVPDINNNNNNNINNNVGSNIHTDKSFLSILHQNQVNGLKIQLKSNGEWVSLDVPKGGFVVMAGDAYHAWSNGRIHAARHQVVLEGDKPRYCLALFSFNHGTTEIPKQMVDLGHPLQFKPFDNFGLARFYLSGSTQMTEGTAKAYCGI